MFGDEFIMFLLKFRVWYIKFFGLELFQRYKSSRSSLIQLKIWALKLLDFSNFMTPFLAVFDTVQSGEGLFLLPYLGEVVL